MRSGADANYLQEPRRLYLQPGSDDKTTTSDYIKYEQTPRITPLLHKPVVTQLIDKFPT